MGGSIPPPAHMSVIVHATRLEGEPPLALVGRRVYHPIARQPDQYWMAFARLWGESATIVNVEHDMEVSADLVDALLACPQPLCTHAYRMHVPREYWAHSTHPEGVGGHWIAEGEESAVWSGIGFCKIEASARVGADGRTGELERQSWPGVETAVNRAVTGPWHLHWPAIEHHHKELR